MATIVEMINPLTGLPEQVDKLDHTAQEIDDAVTRAFKVSARNFLRNWYFVNPVNQRGVSGTISTTGYFIDGWKLVSGTVQITSTGLVLNGTIEQILESGIGQLVKATFLASDGVFDASYNDSTKTFTITATGKTLIAAKLELGSQQTLAHQDADGNWVLNEIPDYGEQLARCQRYRTEREKATGYVSYSSGGAVVISPMAGCSFPTTMRSNPSCAIFAADVAKTANKVSYYSNFESLADGTVASVSANDNGIYSIGLQNSSIQVGTIVEFCYVATAEL